MDVIIRRLQSRSRSSLPVLNALVGDPEKVFEASHGQVWEAIRALVRRVIKSGDIRKDFDPIDLLRALIGVANVSDWQQSARRLVDSLVNCWFAAHQVIVFSNHFMKARALALVNRPEG